MYRMTLLTRRCLHPGNRCTMDRTTRVYGGCRTRILTKLNGGCESVPLKKKSSSVARNVGLKTVV